MKQFILSLAFFILLFILLFMACRSVKPVSEEMQTDIERLVKGRCYNIGFSDLRNLSAFTMESIRWYPATDGNLKMEGDFVYVYFNHPTFDIHRKFKVQDYLQSRTRDGKTLVTFSIERPKEMCYKRKNKDTPLPFCLTISSPRKMEVSIDGNDYKGRFSD